MICLDNSIVFTLFVIAGLCFSIAISCQIMLWILKFKDWLKNKKNKEIL
jgi:hypothetical protein